LRVHKEGEGRSTYAKCPSAAAAALLEAPLLEIIALPPLDLLLVSLELNTNGISATPSSLDVTLRLSCCLVLDIILSLHMH
jgi:hypothetical protein